MRCYHSISLTLRVPLGLALLFIAGLILAPVAALVCAQGLPENPAHSAIPEDIIQDLNQRLKQSSNVLAAKSRESAAIDSQLGPDDLLQVTVFEAPEMNRTLRVSANGEISLQLLGPVNAAGRTPRELELALQELLRRTYMKDPHVGVFVQELQSHPVSVVGAVKKPDVFQIRGTKTLIELLSMAEGLADDAGDTVWIMRGAGFAGLQHLESYDPEQKSDGELPVPAWEPRSGESANPSAREINREIVKVNLKDLLESGDPALNVPVHPGDIVKVSRAGIVYVMGDVKKPGGFVLSSHENISVVQALALAEGLTRTSAKSRARIIRTDQNTGSRIEIPVDLGKILASKAADPTLQPKDIVFVPDSSAKSAFYRGTEAVLYTAAGLVIYRR